MGKNSKLAILLVAISDIALVNLSFITGFALRFGFPLPSVNFTPYVGLIPWLSIIGFIIFYMFDLYANWRRKSIYNLFYSIVLSVLTLTLFTMALTFWYRGFSFPRSVIIVTPLIQVVLLAVSRSLIWYGSKHRYGRKRVLIVGENQADGLRLAEKFFGHDQGWFIITDFVPADKLAAMEQKLAQVDVVLLSSSLVNKAQVIDICFTYGKEVLLVPDLLELLVLGSEAQQVDDMPVLSLQPPGLTLSQQFVKRFFDAVISFVSLLIASPVMLVLFVLIPLNSKGTALFKQERLGKDGRPFNILKFRSMVKDAEHKTGPVLATDKDPRITPVGRFIRATRLDELPQLINVLKGNMSLIGPRPEREYFVKQFTENIPHYKYRMAVKPGITGLAQVMAKYSTSVDDKLRFDLMYVRNYSLALDLKIMLQTIRVVLQREQAQGVQANNAVDAALFNTDSKDSYGSQVM